MYIQVWKYISRLWIMLNWHCYWRVFDDVLMSIQRTSKENRQLWKCMRIGPIHNYKWIAFQKIVIVFECSKSAIGRLQIIEPLHATRTSGYSFIFRQPFSVSCACNFSCAKSISYWCYLNPSCIGVYIILYCCLLQVYNQKMRAKVCEFCIFWPLWR